MSKESASFSISSEVLEMLDIACELDGCDNKSWFVERAINDRIMRKIGANPIAKKLIYQELKKLSS